jgi:hypothetical protein
LGQNPRDFDDPLVAVHAVSRRKRLSADKTVKHFLSTDPLDDKTALLADGTPLSPGKGSSVYSVRRPSERAG